MARGKKKNTPAWVDKLLSFRREIGEEEYRDYWKRINKASRNRKDEEAWNAEGQKIIAELKRSPEVPNPIFRGRDYRTVGDARRAAEIQRNDHGGRIVRRNSKGQFSRRGSTFQVLGGRK